ncbi:MAG TPA: 30S ribosomal protein S3 [Candidatus Paceibacterota bacterium]|jgi:small subunit ribosomal protein S3|nr:30S ribosomal protein S3 [Candidatus Paceibacterota bacterium]HRS47665.1 30S ribosomal protein S3 [Candidatus Paceibacterota bacterium]
MTHKTNPISYRLGINEEWRSRYFDAKNLKFFLEEDEIIRNTINKLFKRSSIEKIDIERVRGNNIKIFISTARPGIIIGRGGKGVEDLRKELLKKIIKFRKQKNLETKNIDLDLSIAEVKKPDISAQLVSENIAIALEKRVPYRKVIKNSLEKITTYKEVKGAKIMVSGRLNGVEIARREWVSKGRIPLVTIRSDIDYAENRAYCTYGVIGIKVWIYKGEKQLE